MQHVPLFVIIKEGVAAGKNPRLLLSYIASFAARGDSILITTFITLWVLQYAKDIRMHSFIIFLFCH